MRPFVTAGQLKSCSCCKTVRKMSPAGSLD